MQSHGLFAARRSTDESSRSNATTHRSNGDVIRNDYRFPDRVEQRTDVREQDRRRYTRFGRDDRDRHVYSRRAYAEEGSDTSYVDRDTEMQPRRVGQRDYATAYEDRGSWRDSSRDLNGSKPILRNGISHARGERLYSSTLPRRSRTINFRDQLTNSIESSRGYPRSLQDLSDLELDDRIRDSSVASFLSANSRDWRSDRLLDDDGYRRRRYYQEDEFEDDYLKLYRNLSRLNRYSQGSKYEPGQVHYERECRTFGNTVAYVYYKTCYL